ncbi:MAG: hypothetical protein A3F90_06830 [Deltaproteobacteria bacterium RIFCSPLOWO2_12_FULL_60_19]|nr:MAG: hypothetical protein A3F90_06830 [Deltaproteobacteria bacterium RIFCSPLOWO2_12_FULL_60_19]
MNGAFSKMRESLSGAYALARDLPEFLAARVTVEQAQEEIKRALDRRQESFLDLARARIYENPRSPYLKLLKAVGCEFADLQSEIHRCGLERTLERLAREGVYLTPDEFKGKKKVVRGSVAFWVVPAELVRADSSPGMTTRSSGSRGRPFRSFLSLDLVAAWALGQCVLFAAHRLFSNAHAVYDAILPAGAGVATLLFNARFGIASDRWFARKIPIKDYLTGWHHALTTYLIVLMGKRYGPGFPRPESVGHEELQRIIDWIVNKRRNGKACCLRATVSNATRIARLAWECGISLEGTKFIVGGEPLTEPKQEVIARAGAGAIPVYGTEPGLYVGLGCANPRHIDDLHVNQYLLALVPRPGPFLPDDPSIHPLLFTTTHRSAPALLLNVELGDYATFDERDCGCALQKAGLTLHLHHIRSYDKFTSEGMNYFYGDLYEFFERTLPLEFGGGPGDYQLVEEEDENGQTRITLRVHPQIGEIDQQKLLARLRDGMGRGSWGNEFQARIWEVAGTLRVKREAPDAGSRGKILPLHVSADRKWR